MKLTYATRRSALALAQCRAFVALLKEKHEGLELVEEQVVTTGDKIQDRPLSEVGGKGLFVKEIEEALLERRADIAVHSIKDVPGVLPPGLVIACIPTREDPCDVIISPKYTSFDDLPEGATIGTSSLRRAVSLRAARPDLKIVPMRGNVDTRLRKVDEGECDAIVLARAGLVRLGLEHRVTWILEPEISLPAVGQGALGIECRADDEKTRTLLAAMHDELTSRCVSAERGVMVALEGDCKTPLGAFGVRRALGNGPELLLRAFVCDPDGFNLRRGEQSVPWPASDDEARVVGENLGAKIRVASPSMLPRAADS
jgi:hydroxymethylbilane synthase